MASNLNVALQGATLQVVNTTDSTTRVNSALGSPTLAASESTYIDFLPIAAGGGTSIPLPAATVYFLAIRNLGGINATPGGNITVQLQALGGALTSAVNSPIITPGGVYIVASPTTGTGGIIAVTLVASVASTPVEILVAA